MADGDIPAITAMSIDGYRGIGRASLEGLTRINVLVGPNGVGKSTVLEAMTVLASAESHDSQSALQFVARHRGGFSGHGFMSTRDDRIVTLGCDRSDGASRSLRINWSGSGQVSDRLVQEDGGGAGSYSGFMNNISAIPPPRCFFGMGARYIGLDRGDDDDFELAMAMLELAGSRKKAISLLAPLLPQLGDLRLLLVDGRPMLFVEQSVGDAGARLWPVVGAGDGLRRLILLACRLAGARGWVLMEDPEAFQHFRSLRQVAALVWNASSSAQVMISTHSMDLVDALLENVNGEPESQQIAIYLLSRSGDVVESRRFTGAQAQDKRKQNFLRKELGYHGAI